MGTSGNAPDQRTAQNPKVCVPPASTVRFQSTPLAVNIVAFWLQLAFHTLDGLPSIVKLTFQSIGLAVGLATVTSAQ